MSELGRTVKEWIGKTPDSAIPERVQLRVLLRHDRKCFLTGRVIRPGDAWECDHKRALSLGGEHRESNLVPVLVEPHKVKTKADRKMKAKADAQTKSAYGITKPKQKIRSRNDLKGPARRGRIELPNTLPPPPLMRASMETSE